MLTLLERQTSRYCDGHIRRNFLKVGALGLGAFGLSSLFRNRAIAREQGRDTKNTSVIWLWLGGGPPQIETFDPKMTAPREYRSTVGEVATTIPGETIGGLFPNIARQAGHFSFVRSFSHSDSGHLGGTHYVMTGHDYPSADQNFPPAKPSIGSIVSRSRGVSHTGSGVPTYIRMGGIEGIYGDGPAFLGVANGAFDLAGEAKRNMTAPIALDRLDDRRELLRNLDRINRTIDRTGLMEGLDSFETQAFDLVLGRSKQAFDIKQEHPRLREKYGTGLGEQLLLARRLCEAGCGFVTVQRSNWDLHNHISGQLKGVCPPVDRACAALVEDIAQRGLEKQILLVITGEFGRTPRLNGNAGRDHWAPLSTLAFAHGGLNNGQFVGKSDAKAELPASTPITPQDLMATVFHVLGIDLKLQYPDQIGRPVSMIENGKPIAELV